MLTHTPETTSGPGAVPNPIAVAQNTAPATIEATNVLSDDTIMATTMDMSPGANQIALFANPFSNGFEEAVYINSERRLCYLSHQEGGPDGRSGWASKVLDEDDTKHEVFTTVHPDGTVYAWVSSDGKGSLGSGGMVVRWRLERGADGRAAWTNDGVPISGKGQDATTHLFVQYLSDRPVTPVVFALYPDQTMYQAWVGDLAKDTTPWDEVVPPTQVVSQGEVLGFGFDGHAGTATEMKRTGKLRRYDALSTGQLVRVTRDMTTGATDSVVIAPTYDEFVGVWNALDGAGCLYTWQQDATSNNSLYAVSANAIDWQHSVGYPLGDQVEAVVAWQDSETLLHVYGRNPGNTVVVAHQTGWQQRPNDVETNSYYPVWDSHTFNDVDYVTLYPLFPSVGEFQVDAFPDLMPSQHTMHTAPVPADERCAFYTQQLGTSLWCKEVVRIPVVQKPYKVTRYQTTLVLKNAFGGAIPAHPMTITSDAPMDLEINGDTYRPSPKVPITVETDFRGRVTLRTVARALSTPTIYARASDLMQGIAVNQAASVQAFLGGTGALPHRKEGFTPDSAAEAKASDGSYLFPGIQRTGAAAGDETSLGVDDFRPTADQVVAWCKYAFAAASKGKLDPITVEGHEQPKQVLGLGMQLWDSSRPASHVFTDADEAQAFRAAECARPGFIGDHADSVWDGDILEAIKLGLVKVKSVGLNIIDGLWDVWIEVKEGLSELWSFAVETAEDAADLVMALFAALEAKAEEVIGWLSWEFDWQDIKHTKDCLVEGIKASARLVGPTMHTLIDDRLHGWFVKEETFVQESIDQIKHEMGLASSPWLTSDAPTLGDKQTVPPKLAGVNNEMALKDAATNPAVNWAFDQLFNVVGDQIPISKEISDPDMAALQAAMDQLKLAFEKLVNDTGDAAVKVAGEWIDALWAVFDLGDPDTFSKTAATSALNCIGTGLVELLKLADDIAEVFSALITALADCIPVILNLKVLEDSWLDYIWRFICEETGIAYFSPTVGDFFGTIFAVPLTLVVKAITGKPPFQGGFPNVNSLATGPGRQLGEDGPPHYDVPQDVQYSMQIMTGIWTLLVQTASDSFANCHSMDLFDDGKRWANLGSVLTFVLPISAIPFLVWDIPVFWGVPNTFTSDYWYEGMWWGIWVVKFFLYGADLLLSAGQYFVGYIFTTEPAVMASYEEGKGNKYISLFTLIELIMATLYLLGATKHGHRRIDAVWYSTMLTAMMSCLTAFARNTSNPRVLAAKTGLDVFTDWFTGVWWMTQASDATDRWAFREGVLRTIYVPPATISTTDVFTATFSYLDSTADNIPGAAELATEPPFLPLHWFVVNPADGKPMLPSLAFEALDNNETGRVVRLTGKIAEPGKYKYRVVAFNTYDPAIEYTFWGDFDLTVTQAPPSD